MILKFSQIAFVIQMPHLKLLDEAEKIKGKNLTENEKNELLTRAEYARRWLKTIATEEQQTSLKEALGLVDQEFSFDQLSYLDQLSESLSCLEIWIPHEIQKVVFEIAKQFETKICFEAIYRLFFNKSSGPQVGWFLSSLDKNFVINRLKRIC